MADVYLTLLLSEDLVITCELLPHLHNQHISFNQLVRQASEQVPIVFLDRLVMVDLLSVLKLLSLVLLFDDLLLLFQGRPKLRSVLYLFPTH